MHFDKYTISITNIDKSWLKLLLFYQTLLYSFITQNSEIFTIQKNAKDLIKIIWENILM